MKIMVFDVPASTGGALTILNQYYNTAVNDKSKEWIFVISTPKLYETDNVKVLNFEWIKKSWLYRLYFDHFIAPKLIKKYNPDEILSLQNVTVKLPKSSGSLMQILYLHQTIPFVNKQYRLLESPVMWMYQHPIARRIYKSVLTADKVIVQTQWMRKVVSDKTGASIDKIEVIPPIVSIDDDCKYIKPLGETVFFYPASALDYKNHAVIFKAVMVLKRKTNSPYRIVLTINGDESTSITKFKEISEKENLLIDFVGTLSKEQVFEYYSKSILLFPSYIETFGLPLLEARMCDCPVIASDMPFSREILDGYDKASFFNYDDEYELGELIKDYL